jgi:hypothetical protein
MREKSEPLINTNEHEFFGGGKRIDKERDFGYCKF